MPTREWTNQDVYDLLCKIDRGYEPDEEERVMLETREELNLWNKKLTYVPRSVGMLRSLRILNLSDNQIPNLPDTIGYLENLTELNLESTQIEENITAHLPPAAIATSMFIPTTTCANVMAIRWLCASVCPKSSPARWATKCSRLGSKVTRKLRSS